MYKIVILFLHIILFNILTSLSISYFIVAKIERSCHQIVRELKLINSMPNNLKNIIKDRSIKHYQYNIMLLYTYIDMYISVRIYILHIRIFAAPYCFSLAKFILFKYIIIVAHIFAIIIMNI